MGSAAGFVILNYVLHETGYDKYHEKRDRIYRVVTYDKIFDGMDSRTPFVMAPVLANEVPDVESAARTIRLPMIKIRDGNSWEDVRFVQCVDPELLDIFSIDFISGNPQSCLNDPSSIVISEKTANTVFPQGNALPSLSTISI